uniref:Transmembrane 9 superfamily member n=1 Tax=Chrysotila carterae TaxID=13221 RepID=A0A6S9YBB9_CHRCT
MLVVVAVVCAEALALTHAASNPNSLLFRNTAGIDGSLVSLGAALGFRSPRLEDPVFTNTIPRQIPYQPVHARLLFSVLVAGLLPFGTASIELALLVSSVWNQARTVARARDGWDTGDAGDKSYASCAAGK